MKYVLKKCVFLAAFSCTLDVYGTLGVPDFPGDRRDLPSGDGRPLASAVTLGGDAAAGEGAAVGEESRRRGTKRSASSEPDQRREADRAFMAAFETAAPFPICSDEKEDDSARSSGEVSSNAAPSASVVEESDDAAATDESDSHAARTRGYADGVEDPVAKRVRSLVVRISDQSQQLQEQRERIEGFEAQLAEQQQKTAALENSLEMLMRRFTRQQMLVADIFMRQQMATVSLQSVAHFTNDIERRLTGLERAHRHHSRGRRPLRPRQSRVPQSSEGSEGLSSDTGSF